VLLPVDTKRSLVLRTAVRDMKGNGEKAIEITYLTAGCIGHIVEIVRTRRPAPVWCKRKWKRLDEDFEAYQGGVILPARA
jgi:hypothetical protein